MPDRDFLRDRGLGDDPPPAQPPPFHVDLDTGQIIPTPEDATTVVADMPNDYAARVLALELACRYAEADVDTARIFHAFLTATEQPAPPREKHTFTDK